MKPEKKIVDQHLNAPIILTLLSSHTSTDSDHVPWMMMTLNVRRLPYQERLYTVDDGNDDEFLTCERRRCHSSTNTPLSCC